MVCSHCGGEIPRSSPRCPHCELPGLFANQSDAEQQDERDALLHRYQAVIDAAESDGRIALVREFEQAVANAKVVISRPAADVFRLVSSLEQTSATYYGLIRGGVRGPSADDWDWKRRRADNALFPGYYEHITFGALSMDGSGLPHYGECAVTLREDCIGHRASVFEENSVTFMEHHSVPMMEVLPKGFRATWNDRARLAVAKLGPSLKVGMSSEAFQSLLLRPAPSPDDDDFIEVHVWGGFTVRSIEHVQLGRPETREVRLLGRAIAEKLDSYGITAEQL